MDRGPHFSDLTTCPDAMGEGGVRGGAGLSFLWMPVRIASAVQARQRLRLVE